jgi:hypothetical protein
LKAALTLKDLPAGWDGGAALDPNAGSQVVRGVYDPAECSVTRHALNDLGKPTTALRGQFFTSRRGETLVQEISSWPTQQQPLVQKVAAALTRCTTFTMTPKYESDPLGFAAKRLPLPGVTDAVGMRFDLDLPGSVMYVVYAVRGGTVLHLVASPGGRLTEADFVRITANAVARLEAAAR